MTDRPLVPHSLYTSGYKFAYNLKIKKKKKKTNLETINTSSRKKRGNEVNQYLPPNSRVQLVTLPRYSF